MATAPSKLSHALEYAREGLRVFPAHEIESDRHCSCGKLECSSAAKHPRVKAWQTLATTDEKPLRQWWSQWPNANVGVACGAESDLTILDIDGPQGAETLYELEKKNSELDAPRVITGGKGGQQLYFRYEDGLLNAVGFAPGLDIRNAGGFAVGVGSVVRREYIWEVSSPPLAQRPRMPAWLATQIRGARATKGNGAFQLPDNIPAGERNSTLYKAARSLKAKQLSEPAALAALKAENATRCQPPLSDDELQSIVKHAFEQADSTDFKGGMPNDRQRRGGQATALVELAKSQATELFHDADQAYVSSIIAGHLETAAIPSTAYRRYLSAAYFTQNGTSPNSENLSAAMATLPAWRCPAAKPKSGCVSARRTACCISISRILIGTLSRLAALAGALLSHRMLPAFVVRALRCHCRRRRPAARLSC